MPKRLRKRPTDVNLLAHMLGNQSTEEPKTNGKPTKTEISRIMAAMGRKGGKKGGKARAARMTEEQRSEAASKAAKARWQPTQQ
jgi:hypothetical protein